MGSLLRRAKRLRGGVLVVSAQDNKTVIRRLIEEVYNEGNLDVVDELVVPDVFNHAAVPEHQHGIDGFKHVIEWVREFSSDVHYEIEDLIAEGEKVAVRMTHSGTTQSRLDQGRARAEHLLNPGVE
jgi:predicted ester cyclase